MHHTEKAVFALVALALVVIADKYDWPTRPTAVSALIGMAIFLVYANRTEIADIMPPACQPIVYPALSWMALIVGLLGAAVILHQLVPDVAVVYVPYVYLVVYVAMCVMVIHNAWRRDEEIATESSMKNTWLAFLLLFTGLYFTLAERFGWPSFEPTRVTEL